MIFVTVGMHDQNFNRLVKAADELAELMDEEVIIQRGCSNYLPAHAKYFDWATSQEMEDWIDRSRLVISHAGAGSILMTLELKKKLVITPRLRVYKEHINDHQLDLGSEIERKGYAVMVLDLSSESLLVAIKEASRQKHSPINPSVLIEAIRYQLSTWQELPRKHKEK